MGFVFIVQWLVVLSLVAIPLMRFQPARFLMGFRDIRRGVKIDFSDEEAAARLIYGAGSKRPKQFGDLAVFEATWGLKILPPVLFVVVIIALFKDSGVPSLSVGLHAFVFIVGGAYMMALGIKSRIVLDGNQLHKLDWKFQRATYDLAELTHAEEDKSGNYRLQFADGRSTFLLKYLTGHEVLKDIVIQALTVNGR